MWMYRSGELAPNPALLYEYEKTRKKEHAREILKDFSGSCVTDGYVPMTNNTAERSIRPFTVGRINWFQIDTVSGAKASAIVYSIAETVKANGLNPL